MRECYGVKVNDLMITLRYGQGGLWITKGLILDKEGSRLEPREIPLLEVRLESTVMGYRPARLAFFHTSEISFLKVLKEVPNIFITRMFFLKMPKELIADNSHPTQPAFNGTERIANGESEYNDRNCHRQALNNTEFLIALIIILWH